MKDLGPVAVAGVRGPLRLEDVLQYAKKAGRIAPLQVVRADRVVGPEHLCWAAGHAARAREEGRAQADRDEVEFTRYLAGERQIKHALARLGIEDGADAALVCALGPKRVDAVRYFVHALGLKEDDALFEPDETEAMRRLEAFGITQAQRQATTPGRELDLVLEAVAEVDLLR